MIGRASILSFCKDLFVWGLHLKQQGNMFISIYQQAGLVSKVPYGKLTWQWNFSHTL